MTVNYSAAVKNSRLAAVAAALNANGGGKIALMTAASAVLVNVNLETVIGAAVGGVLTVIASAKQGTAGAAGAAALAKLTDGAGTTVCDGLTVGTSGTDVVLNDVNIAVSSIVTMNSGTITTP